MQASELRLGNRIQYNGDYGTVITISEYGVTVAFEEEEMYLTYNQIKPIPLTYDRLLKCGFDREHNEPNKVDTIVYDIYYITGTDYLIEYYYEDGLWLFTDDIGLKVFISYLHEIQNLIFALTGQELNINL